MMDRMVLMVLFMSLYINRLIEFHQIQILHLIHKLMIINQLAGLTILQGLLRHYNMNGLVREVNNLAFGVIFQNLRYGLNGEKKVWMVMGMSISLLEQLILQLLHVLLIQYKKMIISLQKLTADPQIMIGVMIQLVLQIHLEQYGYVNVLRQMVHGEYIVHHHYGLHGQNKGYLVVTIS